MNMRVLALGALVCGCLAVARAQADEQFVEITTLPPAQTVYRVATTPAPAMALPAGVAPSQVRYDGAPTTTFSPPLTTYGTPVTAYRAPGVVQTGYAPTVAYQPVTTMPLQPVPTVSYPGITPAYGPPSPPPYKPIVSLSSAPTNGIVGQGIIGQPKLYMPSQPVRNFVRWLTP